MKILWRIAKGFCFCMCLCVCFTMAGIICANADTTNDLRALYNEEMRKGREELRKKYEEAKELQEQMAESIRIAEDHNDAVKEAEQYWAGWQAKIDEEVSIIFKENQSICHEIKDGIDGDISTLLSCDAAYKGNVAQIETLLKEKDKVALTGGIEVDYEGFDKLGKEVSEMQEEYEESSGAVALGDVSKAAYPVQSPTLVTSGFGSRIDPLTLSEVDYHTGIDLRAKVGTPVYALFDGTVISAGYGTLSGYYIRIEHGDGIVSYYAHLSEIQCKAGQKVSQNEQIALSGESGTQITGPHLHFGLYIDGVPVDPEVVFKGVG